MTILETLGEYLSDLGVEAVPPAVRLKAKACIADAVACALTGEAEAVTVAARKLPASSGPSVVWGASMTTSPLDASFLNSVAAHAILMEDVHLPSVTHPGTVVVPAALAAADDRNASGEDLLLAVIVGYEAMCRIGAAINATSEFKRRKFRQSGVFGPLGAAAAAGKIASLDRARMTGALGLAGTLGVGLREWGRAGTSDFAFHNGSAARSGVMAAALAESGLSGPPGLIEGADGFSVAYSGGTADLSQITKSLGKAFALEDVFYKHAPACQVVQTVLQVSARLHESLAPIVAQSGDDCIRQVMISTSSHGKYQPGNDFGGPFESMRQAQMSNQFTAAAGLLYGDASYARYSRWDDTRIASLASRIMVEAEPRIDAAFPAKRGAAVTVVLSDGRKLTDWQDDLHDVTCEAVFARLEDAVDNYCPTEGKQVRGLIEALEDLPESRELSLLLCAGVRGGMATGRQPTAGAGSARRGVGAQG